MKVNTAGLFSLAASAEDVEEVGDIEIVEDGAPPPRPPAAPRMRKSTLESFNDEMSVLDRPLEGEEEFYDEPKPRRWRVPAIGGVIFLASCAAYLGVLRHRGTAEAAAAPAPAVATARPVAATPPVAAAAPAAADPTAAPAAPAAVEAPSAPPAAAPAAAPVVADASGAGAHHHHHGRHASASASASTHHHHHGGHGHHGRA
jgi:hypothetical protein